MLNWHVCLCGHSVVQHILVKKGRDSREAAKPTWELKDGCLAIFYTHIEGLAFDLAHPNRAKAKQTWRALFQRAANSKWRATGTEHLHGKMTRDLGTSLAWSLLRTHRLDAASATAFRAAVLAGPTLPGIPGGDLCACLPLLCCPLAPHSSPASPASSLRPSLGLFVFVVVLQVLRTSANLPIPQFFNFLCRVRSLYLLYERLNI